MRVLIAGCGYVGTALGLLLAEGGHEVHGLRRDPSGLPAPIQPVAADLVTRDGLDDLPEVDACVATIAAGGRTREAYQNAYVRGLEHLRDALAATSPDLERWLFTSSTAVYADAGGDWVDEDSPTQPAGFSGERVLDGERIVRTSAFPIRIVLRLGGIYGPTRTRLLDQVRAGEATIPPEPTWTNRIHRDDAAGALAHLLTLDDPDEVYLGVDRDPAERGEVLRWLADRLGAPAPQPGESTSRGNKRARSDRLVASGYAFRYPSFRDGYAAMLASDADG